MGSEVKRYGPTSRGMVFGQQHLIIGESLDGDFVKYEDYNAIEAENTRLGQMLYERNNELSACETERDKLYSILRKVLSTHDYHTDDGEAASDEAYEALASHKAKIQNV